MSAADVLSVVFDAIWQGVVLCAVVALGLRLGPRRNAATLGAIWTAILAACVGVMALDALARQAPPAVPLVAQPVHAVPAAQAPPQVTVDETYEHANAAAEVRVTLVERVADLAGRVALPVIFVALLIVALRCCALAWELRATLLARRRVTRIEPPFDDLPQVARAYAFASSATATTPHVLGFGRPLVVLPAALLAAPRERIRGVILHELAHVRRYDDVRGAIEATLAAMLWWNPGVRFALVQIARLRERICDDAAVIATHDDIGYVTILAEIARGATLQPLGVPCFSTRGTVLERVRAILDRSVDHSPRPDRTRVAAAGAVAALLALATARVHVPVAAATPAIVATSEQQDGGNHSVTHVNDNTSMHFHAHGTPQLPQAIRGTWTLARCDAPGNLRLGIMFDVDDASGSESWDETACVPAAEFRGMSPSTLASASGTASFSVVRSAGTFDATGHFEAGSGAGTYVFAPSQAFAARLTALGHGSPNLEQLFALTLTDFQSSELDALAAHGYDAPTPDELLQLAYSDAGPDFIRTAIALPAKTKTVAQLLSLRQSGFRAEDIDEIERFGYRPTLEQFIELAHLGARPEYVQRLRASGYTSTSVDDLIARRERGQ